MSSSSSFLEININTIKQNILAFKQRCNSNVCFTAVIKADAYGHGASVIAKSIEDEVEYFAVATINEGINLRDAGIKNKILIFSGVLNSLDVDISLSMGLTPVIHSFYQYRLLKNYLIQEKINIWLNVNTGMNQLGLNYLEFEKIYNELKLNKINVFTHLSKSEEIDASYSEKQILDFYKVIANKTFSNISVTNSSGTFRFFNSAKMNNIRIGIGLYGASNFNGLTDTLKIASSFKSYLIAIRCIKKGTSIGYGNNFCAIKDMTIGVVSAGYADGYPRTIATDGSACVLINDTRCSIVGAITMDTLTVDISDIANNALIGDIVTLWSDKLPISEIAMHAKTVICDLMAGVKDRVERVYI